MPRNPERSINLVNFVREELDRFKSGEINHISTNEELRVQFDYKSIDSFSRLLQKADLVQERRGSRSQIKEDIIKQGGLSPSRDLAWLLGILAGGGYVNPGVTGKIQFINTDQELVKEVMLTEERCFQIQPKSKPYRIQSDGRESIELSIYNRELARKLGDLRLEQWPMTILEKHRWILDRRYYTWPFLEALFDVRGSTGVGYRRIFFNTNNLNVANFIADLLIRVGSEDPQMPSSTQRITGVELRELNDIKFFAQNIHSVIPAKEEELESYRKLSRKLIPRGKSKEEFLIDEYKKAREICLRDKGRLPTNPDLIELRSQGVIGYSVNVLANYFGEGSIINARKYLETMLSKEVIDQISLEKTELTEKAIKQLEQKKYRTFTFPKEIVHEWIKLTESLGHIPRQKEISSLRSQEETEFSASVYTNHFGKLGSKVSFSTAMNNLDKITTGADYW